MNLVEVLHVICNITEYLETMILIKALWLNQIKIANPIALALADNRATKEASLAVPWITPPPELFSPFSSTPLKEVDQKDILKFNNIEIKY